MLPKERFTPWLRNLLLGGTALVVLAAMTLPLSGAAGGATTLPEFRDTSAAAWINSKPLTRADLRGKVVLIEVYTSG